MSLRNLVLRSRTVLVAALLSIVAIGTSPAEAQTVTFTNYPVMAGFSFTGITAGADGAVWFSGSSSGITEIGRITTDGVITQIVTSNVPSGITAGPDGALWFTEPAAHQIGRITTGGAITEYGIPCCAAPSRITAGPDGALWFTEGHKIGRITTDGLVTEYPLPDPDRSFLAADLSWNAIGITAGPDGALWFTEPVEYTDVSGDVICLGTQMIGRIDTIGVVTEYLLPYMGIGTGVACGDAGSIVAGSDGALWFNTAGDTSIGRITTAGVFTRYPISPPPRGPFVASTHITAGPDGALWFPAFDVLGTAVTLDRITTAGIITQYSTPSSVHLVADNSQITNGPDGALWFTVSGSIVRAAINPVSIHIDTPQPGGTVSGIITIAGWAITSLPGIGISNVQVQVDGIVVGTAIYGTSRPDVCSVYPGRQGCPNVGFSYQLNTAALTLGSHMITATATDTNGASETASASVTVNVAAIPPTVYIDAPAAGSVLSGSATVTGWAIDNTLAVGTAISSVQVQVDGNPVGDATYGAARPDVCGVYPGRPGCPNVGFTYSLNAANLGPGPHTITVTATDTDGTPDIGKSSVTITVANAPPSVYIDSPTAGMVVSGNVTVSGWALDNTSSVGTSINSVQVKVDGVVVGSATYGISRPDVCDAYSGRPGCPNVGFTYNLNAASISPGSHLITVTATDSDASPDAGSWSVIIQVAH